MSSPSRPSDDSALQPRHEVVRQLHPLQRPPEHELARVEDERLVVRDRQQLGQVRLRRPRVDVGVAVVAEHPERRGRGGGRPTTAGGPPGRTGRCGPARPRARSRMSRSARTLMRVRFPFLRSIPPANSGVHLALEVLEVLEALVDRGEPDVGDVVERPQLVHRQRPDARRRAPRTGPALRSSPSISSAARSAASSGTGRRVRALRQARRRACRGRTPGASPSRLTTTRRAASTRS